LGLALLHFLMISVLWAMTLFWFTDRNRYKKHVRMHHFSFGLLVVYCILALISQPLVIKIYAILSVVAVIVVEAAITKSRKKSLQDEFERH
ncbi:MAG TPA: hypothetical protein VEL78_01585, partial [Pyrinomonadaceae bacterium]|nr:hypothetical protein [Pyrinomonadaceae bacterium]